MNLKVLVIDDDLFILSGVRKVLQRDYETKVADSARIGKKIAESFAPDIVFVDLILGEDSGLDLLEELRALLPAADLIAMTGVPGTEIRSAAYACGADWFVGKEELALCCAILDRIVASRRSVRLQA